MRTAFAFVLCALAAAGAAWGREGGRRQVTPEARAPIEPVPLAAVRVEDAFWSPKLKVYRENTIPHSWPYVESSVQELRNAAAPERTPAPNHGLWSEANLHKLLETVACALARGPDPELDRRMDEVISIVAAGQREDGFAHAWVINRGAAPWGHLGGQHDGYVTGHLIEAAVAHFRATGKRSYLDVARKAADQAWRHFVGGGEATRRDGALVLEGASTFVAMPEGVLEGLSAVTIAAWVRVDSDRIWTRIFDFGSGTDVNMFLTPRSAAQTLRLAITTSGAAQEEHIDAPPLPVGEWRHVALTLSGKEGRLYVDGAEAARNDALTLGAASLGRTRANYIGKSQYPNDALLTGAVDDFRIYASALSPEDVARLHRAGRNPAPGAPPGPRCHARYTFDRESGREVRDVSGNGRNAKLGTPDGFPGHAEIELALVELHRATGEKRYLDLARELTERRGIGPDRADPRAGYFQNHAPVREQDAIEGHAVRAVFFATGVADVAIETGDEGLRAAAMRLWRSATERRMYVTGSVGSEARDEAFGPDYRLPNNGYCESCAACGMVNFAHRILRMEGDARAADELERVLYNAVLHGIALDGRSSYYCNPPSDRDHPRDNNWTCCPPTLSRTLLGAGGYAYAQTSEDVYVNLFVGGECRVELAATPVTLRVETEYPWKGAVRIAVEPERRAAFALRVRIPGWCRGAAVSLNGRRVARPETSRGYAVLRRRWTRGDVVEFDMPMPVTRVEAHPRVDACAGKVAIVRGPIVYGLEGLDNGGDPAVTLPERPEFAAERRPDMLGGVTVVRGRAADGRAFLAIPFYVLANRERSRQEVWVEQAAKRERAEGWDGLLYREYAER